MTFFNQTYRRAVARSVLFSYLAVLLVTIGHQHYPATMHHSGAVIGKASPGHGHFAHHSTEDCYVHAAFTTITSGFTAAATIAPPENAKNLSGFAGNEQLVESVDTGLSNLRAPPAQLL